MTREQLFEKWSLAGGKAARKDIWMTPYYEDDLESGDVGIDDLLFYGREQWESTDHFQILYGGSMYYDALDFFINLNNGEYPNTEDITNLKMYLIDTFWDAWEDEIGAAEIIAELRENQPKVLADKMLDLLEIVVKGGKGTVRFTEKALQARSPEFLALVQWMNSQNGSTEFLLGQSLYMLEYIASNGLDNPEDGLPDADIYTADLTNWLAGNVHNLNYVTDILEADPEIRDGIKLLQQAQCLAIRDAWLSLAQVLKGLLA